MSQPDVSLLGIRHHGPGSARSVVADLNQVRPDVLLVEGPSEADGLVRFVADEGMRPPVALLGYDVDEPRRAAFWPFAAFSPEWQAMRWALAHNVPVRFCDLPLAVQLAVRDDESGDDPVRSNGDASVRLRADPLAMLASAAGYGDAERWWEDVVEHRLSEPSPFPAIAEAMAAVRAEAPEPPERELVHERRREAHMRKVLRAAAKEGFDRIAVVCGAWHVPALADLPTVASDNRVLKGLPRRKVAMSWVPWTHGRLSWWSGYGAGVSAPGWYHHLFAAVEVGHPEAVVSRWLVDAANVLRAEDLPVSSAHVIEGVRLAETLAALRGRPLAGLDEVTDATRAVLCEGSESALALVQRRLVVGEVLGEVPEGAPAVPLAEDLCRSQRRLRLAPQAAVRELDLDLRTPSGLGRSRLLHRLRLLDIDWGKPVAGSRGKGTFREEWRLAWKPELAVSVVEAALWGTTVESAVTARVHDLAERARDVAELATLVERCLLADLAEAMPRVMAALRDRAAVDREVTHLMRALPPLVRARRYGDVRGTDASALAEAVDGLIARIRVGLPPASGSLDDDGAAELVRDIDAVDQALRLVADEDPVARDGWLETLASVASREGLHGLLAGRLVRMLHDAGRLDAAEVARQMGLALTPGVPPAAGAAWIEGFLSETGLILCHDDHLLTLVDAWVGCIPADSFTDVLPLLRRTFSTFSAPERQLIGQRVRRGGAGTVQAAEGAEYDEARGALVVPRVLALLGAADD